MHNFEKCQQIKNECINKVVAIENKQTSLKFLAIEFSPYKLCENLISRKDCCEVINKMVDNVIGN